MFGLPSLLKKCAQDLKGDFEPEDARSKKVAQILLGWRVNAVNNYKVTSFVDIANITQRDCIYEMDAENTWRQPASLKERSTEHRKGDVFVTTPENIDEVGRAVGPC